MDKKEKTMNEKCKEIRKKFDNIDKKQKKLDDFGLEMK